ncbi:hypothetical protein NAEGRDRAFT_59125 [Naegleria gruberi]|uniref:DUF4116 domain-containing protein n=1 Tax=Naegleria gruberi TaxID=5762 RepID=D2VST1_NAEGR|nr:uncharacterized protein NAEGRDRAFT_59125 [Naegleria gruberi]EFC40249.1 hypothetical protein NAEGRDRAFT_59125 [Naegleria gruberi]|eukprot:XP_002672993.1 hypothetical protein NAEGRDRAFT_59125 [Naegleria gruberi strain NEG-M]
MKRKADHKSFDFPASKIANFNSEHVNHDDRSENVILLLNDFYTRCDDADHCHVVDYQQLLYNKFQMQTKGKIKWFEYRYECMKNPLKYIPIEFCKDAEFIIHTLNSGKLKLSEDLFNNLHPILRKPMFLFEIMDRIIKLSDESKQPSLLILAKSMETVSNMLTCTRNQDEDCSCEVDGFELPDFMNRICFSEEELLDDEEHVLQNITSDGTVRVVDFMRVSERLRNDYKFMINLFKKFKFTIEACVCVGSKLKSDRQFILELAKLTPFAMVLVPEELRTDKNFIMDIVAFNPTSIKLYRNGTLTRHEILNEMKEKMKNQLNNINDDKELAIKSLLFDIDLIQYISPKLLNDREFMIEAVQQILQNEHVSGRNYLHDKFYDCEELRDNSDYMLKCITITDNAFQFVTSRLRNDKDFILEALKFNTSIYRYIPIRLLMDDREFLFKCLAITGKIIKLADTFKSDKEVVMAALKSDGSMIRYADDLLKTDRDFIIQAKKNAELDIGLLPEMFTDDRDFVLEFFNPNNYSDISFIIESDYYDDEEFLMKLLKKGFKYSLLPQSMMDSIECVKLAVGLNGTVLKKVDEEFQNDKEIQKEAIKSNGFYLVFSQDLFDYRMECQYFGCHV